MARRRQTRRAPETGAGTRAVHAGEAHHRVSGPVATPIVQTSTFTFASVAEMKRWAEGRSKADIYTRYGNPTLRVVEAKLAALERAEAALVAASGMAAISTTLLSLVGAGEEIIATRQLYGGTYRLMRDLLPRLGIQVHYVEADLRGVEARVNRRTRVLYVETPTNPTLRLVDLRQAAQLARRLGLVSIVDNTFASPIWQRPAEFGFDLAVHSATKYLGGHSDLIAGAVAGRRRLVEKIRHTLIQLGGSLDPGAGYLLLRGMKTLQARMERQSASALAVAQFLEKHPRVARVYYPGLRSHPDHRLARRQMDGFGAMLAFDPKGGLPAARRIADRVRVFLLAASLGGVESLVVLPAYTSHYRMLRAELAAAGITPGTLRLSIGIEDLADLIADLKQALA
ncbi:aminotransferase class I/II-fold pyridoxal phosphate-dependent enzyme [Acidobacteriia bacterium AH_259_A11_L15]|nr:aminotransferase class I/II-fold pyridoxal phosphate-dependent enzyme [Acidobacteriia bacterium AH_259_A11_L15]